ncbi:unnamed protein product [Staurois parvus]|uniref:Surfeit locus protein 2 n=1 Tax=Staurois parvus TaxID=386267 RepID=A0ABN9AT29_9NEOB|nr:unnamed protein product [Staurois parvus]
MEELTEDVRGFLLQHPELQPVSGNKIRFTLTGHELPCRLPDLQNFTTGKKYKNLMEVSFDGSKYEPHIVPSTKNTGQLFCKLTLRHITKRLEDVERHINGKRYQRALRKYEECQKLGVEYVPTCLQNKTKQRKFRDDGEAAKKKLWEPNDSSGEDSDSGDSMSDLYPGISNYMLLQPLNPLLLAVRSNKKLQSSMFVVKLASDVKMAPFVC